MRRDGLVDKRLVDKRLAGKRLAGKRLAGKRLAGKRLAGKRLAGKRQQLRNNEVLGEGDAVTDNAAAGSSAFENSYPAEGYVGDPAVQAEWDGRYAESEQLWSGRPNGALVTEVAELTPGRALDVGCGEGADAI